MDKATKVLILGSPAKNYVISFFKAKNALYVDKKCLI